MLPKLLGVDCAHDCHSSILVVVREQDRHRIVWPFRACLMVLSGRLCWFANITGFSVLKKSPSFNEERETRV